MRWIKVKPTGFTMIELLVVIAVIGVLAVAVLSSINPLEQINKGRDTKKRSDAAQVLNAIDRYYASQEEYPFDVKVLAGNENSGELPFDNNINYNQKSILDALVTVKEIKAGFRTRLTNDKKENYLFLYVDPNTAQEDGDVEGVYVCFSPSSNSFRSQAYDHASDWSFVQGENTDDDGVYYICLP